MYRMTENQSVIRIEDGACFPPDPSNSDFQAFLAWQAEGNEPEPYVPLPVRRLVRKSVVQGRLIAAGKMNAAYAALTANPVHFARWFAPDRPEVYADDQDALALLAAIGADAGVVMAAPEHPPRAPRRSPTGG